MNVQSLRESNAILAAAAARWQPGQRIEATPAELAEEAGLDSRLGAARAIRALISRGRIEQDGRGYRLLDARPLAEGEPTSVHRPVRRRKRGRPRTGEEDALPTYEQVGKVVIERLIELSAEAAEMRAALERARAEAEAARREAVEVNRAAAEDRRRSQSLEDEVSALRRRLEMTEGNLRSLVQAARQRPAAPLEDTDAKAILDILSRTGAGADRGVD
jgi:hypothetical protein